MTAPLRHAVSVKDLARFTTRSGDLGASVRGATRGWEGIRAHQRALAERPEGYQREKTVRAEFPFSEFTLAIDGRVDGCHLRETDWRVEEVKSTRFDLDHQHPDRAVHLAQALLYAGLLLRDTPRPRVSLRLIYTHLDTGEERAIEQDLEAAEVLGRLDAAIEDYAGWFARVLEWHQDARVAAKSASWPFPEWRLGQRELVDLVGRAVARGQSALAEAPTGLGKTAAVLHAGALALAAREVSRVFYLTARNSGKASARDALARLRAHGFRLKAVEITARDAICTLGDGPCAGAACPGARGYYERVRDALEAAFDGADDWSPDFVRALAARFALCPYELSLDLASWADVVVCDFNHAFDPQARLRRFFDSEPKDYLLLVDEAHNLPARARDMFSPIWDGREALAVSDAIALDAPLLTREIRALQHRLNTLFGERTTPARPYAALTEIPEELLRGLRRLAALTDAWFSSGPPPAAAARPLRRLGREIAALLQAADRMDDRHRFLLDRAGDEVRARVFCRDPAPQLAQVLQRMRSAVFFSATLRPLDYFLQQVGVDPRACETLTLASPFPPEHLRVALETGFSTAHRSRAANTAAIAGRIRDFLAAEPGNHLVFFPSFDFLRAVARHFELEVSFGSVLLQRPRMGAEERAAFLARFEGEQPGGLAGFAVIGGVFSEGVDLPGERLKGVVVVGAGLPAVCLENELVRLWHEEQGRPGFEYAYTFPGFNRVMQAVGRVIRSEEDTGRALLLDHRYREPRYFDLFPAHWRIPAPPEYAETNPEPQWIE